MMGKKIWTRLPAAVVALAMGISAIQWLSNPAAAAESLGMPLLTGLGLSSQVGDFSAFFVGTTVFCVFGIIRSNTTWLYAAALLLAMAAVFRTSAWLFHGASLATALIVVEIVFAGLVLLSAWLISKPAV
jgi:hypothetical protein